MKLSTKTSFFLVLISNSLVWMPEGQLIAQAASGYTFSFLAGQGVAGPCDWKDGVGLEAKFCEPSGLALDSSGNIFVADTGNNSIREVTSEGTVTTIAGSAGPFPFSGAGSSDGTGPNAQFSSPAGIAFDAAGNLFIADSGNFTIRRMTLAAEVTTFAGMPGHSGSVDGTADAARFWSPGGIVVDGAGNVYVAEIGPSTPPRGISAGGHTVRKITAGQVVTTLAGTAGFAGSRDGIGTNAQFNLPTGLAVDSTGNIYVVDSGNYTIRKITPSGTVSTLAGSAGNAGNADGTGVTARFRFGGLSDCIYCSLSGKLYVADNYNNAIRVITPSGEVSTLVKNIVVFPNINQITSANNISLDSTGNIFLTDGNILFQGQYSAASQSFAVTITRSGPNVILSWPASATGFTLQSSTDVLSGVWTMNLAVPDVVNGQNIVTNSIAKTRQFFRLSQ